MFARLLILFVTVPLVELVLLLEASSRLGPWATLALILLTGTLGAWLARSQGLRVLRRAQEGLSVGRLPQDEVLEGLLVLLAGAVLLTPGFLTDACGFFLLIPPCRAWARKRLSDWLARRFGLAGGESAPKRPREAPQSDEVVIDAEVIPPGKEERGAQ